jgi:formylglycine-generating enzyme required for sulfatase activity
MRAVDVAARRDPRLRRGRATRAAVAALAASGATALALALPTCSPNATGSDGAPAAADVGPARADAAPRRAPAAHGWVYIEAGTFLRGSPPNEPGRLAIETQHEVTLTTDYLLQPTEVTQEQFAAVMGYNPAHFTACGPSCPVEDVTWHEAAAYCNRLSEREGLATCYSCTGAGRSVHCQRNGAYPSLYECAGYRLPSEAEWEHAARAGEAGSTPDGTIAATQLECDSPHPLLDPLAWFCGNSGGRTHPVAQKEPNPRGLYDMLGNVWEWNHDWDSLYPTRPVTDPWGPVTGLSRVGHGGSWVNKGLLVRFAARGGGAPDKAYGFLGFRPARSCHGAETEALCRHTYRSRWAAAADAGPVDAAPVGPPAQAAPAAASGDAAAAQAHAAARSRRNSVILGLVGAAVVALFALDRLVRARRRRRDEPTGEP